MANPQAMVQAVAAAQALEFIGMPEARLNLAQAIIYICESPKSNSVLMGIEGALAGIQGKVEEPVPLHLRDTHYKGAPHSLATAKATNTHMTIPAIMSKQDYMPRSVQGDTYYHPSEMGQERKIAERHRLFAYIEIRP